ncbi:hypothetical protein V8E36_004327 [Tilletia maclaganii]
MRFRWSYYYDDLEAERHASSSHHHSQPQGAAPDADTTSPGHSLPTTLFPPIPYLVYPQYSGDIPAIDYHAARAASAASFPADLNRIAQDEANYAASQLQIAQALARKQRAAAREARLLQDEEAAISRKRRRRRRKGVEEYDDDDDDEERPELVSDHFESVSFHPSDLLPSLHGPALGSPTSQEEEEASARRRASAIVRLGAGLLPNGWKPPPIPGRLWPSHPRPHTPLTASMSQRMAALGTVYSLGLSFEHIPLPRSRELSLLLGPRAPAGLEGARGGAGAASTTEAEFWSLTHSTFSAWFPPPYRVLTLVALGILVFAADLLILGTLGIDPVPLLFPSSSRGGAARRTGGSAGAGEHGLGPGLTQYRQLGRALLLLGGVYTALALGGWASFRLYVDSSLFTGDPSGRHAQALQGLAIMLAVGLACWPGRVLFRPIRYAFWTALGRLFWPENLAARTNGNGRLRTRTRTTRMGDDGNEEQQIAEEMDLFDQDAADDVSDRAPLTSSHHHAHAHTSTNTRRLRARALLRLTLGSLRDTTRWLLAPTFSAVILADVLTSFAKVFADVWLTACFLVPRREHHTWWNGRGSVVVPILTSLPYLIRLRQCISEYLSTHPSYSLAFKPSASSGAKRSRKPLYNAFKYFSALPVIWLAALEGFASSELAAWESGLAAEGRVEALGVGGVGGLGVGQVRELPEGVRVMRRELWEWGEEARWRQRVIWRCWLFWVFFNSIFSFWWDVTHDWSLDMFRLRTVSRIVNSSSTSSSSHTQQQATTGGHHHRRGLSTFLLRPPTTPLLFPEWAYHLSILLDLILRFTWSIKLSSQLFRYADWEGGVFVLEALEIVRRGAWVVLRFEHAALVHSSSVGSGGASGLRSGGGAGLEQRRGSHQAGGYADEDGEEDEEAGVGLKRVSPGVPATRE